MDTSSIFLENGLEQPGKTVETDMVTNNVFLRPEGVLMSEPVNDAAVQKTAGLGGAS